MSSDKFKSRTLADAELIRLINNDVVNNDDIEITIF
jgi:hypothetical protein